MSKDYQTSSTAASTGLISIAALDRRRFLRGLGIAGALAVAAGRINLAGAQDAIATPTAPQVGPRADGSQLWRVQVAGGSMDAGIELMGFFPGEITINAGDAIFFDL